MFINFVYLSFEVFVLFFLFFAMKRERKVRKEREIREQNAKASGEAPLKPHFQLMSLLINSTVF